MLGGTRLEKRFFDDILSHILEFPNHVQYVTWSNFSKLSRNTGFQVPLGGGIYFIKIEEEPGNLYFEQTSQETPSKC